MKKYKFGFDPYGLLLFLIIMIPNFIWTMKPAPNDILRSESLTPVLDIFMSIFQVLFVGAMCGIRNKEKQSFLFSLWLPITGLSIAIYYISWGFYYSGVTGIAVIILLTLATCTAFIAFLTGRKNYIALLPGILFSICHLLHAILNFLV